MKNLKKGLAVAMSLAMIATVMPTMKVDAVTADQTSCSTKVAKELAELGKEIVTAIKADLKTAGKTIKNTKDGDSIEWTITKGYLESGTATDSNLEDLLAVAANADSDTIERTLAMLADCAGTTDEGKDAAYIVGKKTDATKVGDITANSRYLGIANAVSALTNATSANNILNTLVLNYGEKTETYAVPGITGNVAGTAVKVGKINSFSVYSTEKDVYNTLVDAKAYVGNIATTDADKANELFELLLPVMEEELNSYAEGNNTIAKEYEKQLKLEEIADLTIATIVDNGVEFERTNLEGLEDFIEDLKADKISSLSEIAAYADVEDMGGISEYVEYLENMVVEIKEVNDILKSTNADFKGYTSAINAKVNTFNTKLGAYIASDTDVTYGEYQTALAAFSAKELTAIQTFVEDVFNEFYELTPVLRSNGKYAIRTTDTEYVKYLTATDVTNLNKAIATSLTTLVETTSDETYYDNLTDSATDASKLYKATVINLKGITLNSTMTSATAAKIVAAKSALTTLEENRFAGLTSKEKREVKANAELIKALYTKLLLSGTITESGWIDLGNGNWDFINEDGTKSTKWVAAGTNWYFVQAGHMLRNSWVAQDATGAVWYYVDNAGKMVVNTTIDGYVINANGEWHKK